MIYKAKETFEYKGKIVQKGDIVKIDKEDILKLGKKIVKAPIVFKNKK